MIRWFSAIIFCACFFTTAYCANTKGTLTIASAADFYPTLQRIAQSFKKDTGNTVLISVASTGKLYLQIKNGAPFDIYFAADSMHPQKLVTEDLALPDTLITYAQGRLVLWSPHENVSANGLAYLQHASYHFLAIANVNDCPYGVAAQQFLEKNNLWSQVKSKLVTGDNVSQTLNFARSGNADLAIIAYSQVIELGDPSHIWLIPKDSYKPIKQQAVILKQSTHVALARQFMQYLQTPAIADCIKNAGYQL